VEEFYGYKVKGPILAGGDFGINVCILPSNYNTSQHRALSHSIKTGS